MCEGSGDILAVAMTQAGAIACKKYFSETGKGVRCYQGFDHFVIAILMASMPPSGCILCASLSLAYGEAAKPASSTIGGYVSEWSEIRVHLACYRDNARVARMWYSHHTIPPRGHATAVAIGTSHNEPVVCRMTPTAQYCRYVETGFSGRVLLAAVFSWML